MSAVCAHCGQPFCAGHICPALTGITPGYSPIRERTIDEKITYLAGQVSLLQAEVLRLRARLGGTA